MMRTKFTLKNTQQLIGLTGFAVLLAAVVLTLLGYTDIDGMVLGTVGAAVSGTVSDQKVREEVDGMKTPALSKIVTQIRPQDTPLDTVLREIGSAEQVDGKSFEVKYYQNSIRPTVAKTTGAIVGGWGQHDIPVDTVSNFALHYVLRVPSVFNSAGKELRLFVTAKNISAKTLSVIAVNGDEQVPGDINSPTLIPYIPANTNLYAIGIAKNELDASTEAMEMIPTSTINYCQIFMCQVEQGVYEEITNSEVNYGMLDYKADAIYMMRMLADLTTLYGAKAVRYNPQTDKLHYFSSGAIENVGGVKTYSLSIPAMGVSELWLNELVQEAFSGINGSGTRAFFVSPNLMGRLQNIKFVQKQIEANKTEVKFGVKFNVVDTAFGTMYLKVHNGLPIAGDTDGGFVLDLNNIRRRELHALKWTNLKFDETGISKVKAARLEEAFCCEFRNIKSHMYIQAVA